MPTLQRYNIAFLPSDPTVQAHITDISRRYFRDIQDEYILGPEGLAHITLCQFKTDDPERAVSVYQDVLGKAGRAPVTLTIEQFRVRPGTLVNAGKFIAEYIMRPDESLMNLQRKCADHLAAHDLTSLTPTKTYSPHITLARLSALPDTVPAEQDLCCPYELTVHLALGLSTEAGVFVKELDSGQTI